MFYWSWLISMVGQVPLCPWLSWIAGVNECKIVNFWLTCACVASCQVLSVISFEGPISVVELDWSPLRGGSTGWVWVGESGIGSNWTGPAIFAYRQPFSVLSLEGDLVQNSQKFPLEKWTSSLLDSCSVFSSTSITELQETSFISLKSHISFLWHVGVFKIPLCMTLCGIWFMDKGKVAFSGVFGAKLASGQIFAIVWLEGVFSGLLKLRSPKGIGFVGSSTHKCWVRVHSFGPAVVASLQIKSVASLEGHLTGNSFQEPDWCLVFDIFNRSRIILKATTSMTNSQVHPIIRNKSNISSSEDVGVLDIPLCKIISRTGVMDEGKVGYSRVFNTILASSQVSTTVWFEGVFAIWLELRGPKRRCSNSSGIHKGWIRVKSICPAVVASGKIKSIASLESYLASHFFQGPNSWCILDGLDGSRIRLQTSTFNTNSQVLSIIRNQNGCTSR